MLRIIKENVAEDVARDVAKNVARDVALFASKESCRSFDKRRDIK